MMSSARVSALLLFVLLLWPRIAEAEPTRGQKLMMAATVALSNLTFPVGDLSIKSDELAVSTTGTVYRKLADCVYGLEEGDDKHKHIEMVDFSKLNGRYNYGSAPMVGANLTFYGTSQRTRCFVIAGNKGCQAGLQISHMPGGDIQRVIDDVNFIQRTACPPAQPEPY